MKTNRLNILERIEDIEKALSLIKGESLLKELSSITIESLELFKSAINLEELESRLKSVSILDFESLKNAYKIFQNASFPKEVKIANNLIHYPNQELKALKEYIEKLEKEYHLIDNHNILISLELLGNRYFYTLTKCAAKLSIDLSKLKNLIMDKLEIPTEEQISKIWNQIKSEFDEINHNPMKFYKEIADEKFLNFTGIKDIKEKIGNYYTFIKPNLVIRMIEDGIESYPINSIGIARILSWSEPENIDDVTETELVVARSISRIIEIWQSKLYKDEETLLNLLRIANDGTIAKGADRKEAKKEVQTLGDDFKKLLLYELKKLIRISEAIITFETPIEKALLQYKLSLEILSPKINSQIDTKNELQLQKELSKFLITKDIYVVGTKFGQNEIDLFANTDYGEYVIETKLYKIKSTLSERKIRANLTQLQSYMDIYKKARKGILVIYNRTEKIVEAPKKWIHGRYWILPINLLDISPHMRKSSILIDQSDNKAIINVEENKFNKKKINKSA